MSEAQPKPTPPIHSNKTHRPITPVNSWQLYLRLSLSLNILRWTTHGVKPTWYASDFDFCYQFRSCRLLKCPDLYILCITTHTYERYMTTVPYDITSIIGFGFNFQSHLVIYIFSSLSLSLLVKEFGSCDQRHTSRIHVLFFFVYILERIYLRKFASCNNKKCDLWVMKL